MKIMFWNIFKLGSTKLGNTLNASVIAANGLGNNVQDYIVKVATGNAVWSNATSTTPADVFVIIELVSGGNKKGSSGFGACIRVLKALKASMNTATGGTSYDYVPPKLTGFRECVGVIYNTTKLTFVSSESMRTTANAFLLPRTAFWAKFTQVGTTRPLNIVGIHGPTSSPASSDYKDAVAFTNELGEVAQINQSAIAPKQDTLIGGDFNCDPLNYYSKKANGKSSKVTAFSDLTNGYKYTITLANGTLSSVRDSVDSSQTPPANYLSQPYDNIVFQLPTQSTAPAVKLVDLVGKSTLYTTNLTAVFNACRKVSDHLPLTVSY